MTNSNDLIGYGRVSTTDQNPNLQIDALSAEGCKETFIDKASGVLRERPELRKALNRLKAGSTLVVWKLDRLGRSLLHLLEIIREIEAKGANLKVLAENIDTTTSMGRFFFAIIGALGEFTRERIREAQAAGIAAAKSRGVKLGAKRKLNNSDLRSADILQENGATLVEIAKTLGVDPATLWRARKRREAATILAPQHQTPRPA